VQATQVSKARSRSPPLRPSQRRRPGATPDPLSPFAQQPPSLSDAARRRLRLTRFAIPNEWEEEPFE